MDNDDDDQALPDIFEPDDHNDNHQAHQAPPVIPEPEFEHNIAEPEPQLIEQEQQQNATVPVIHELVQPDPNGPRRSTRERRQEQRYIPSMQGNRYH
jgi:hypothetical protein